MILKQKIIFLTVLFCTLTFQEIIEPVEEISESQNYQIRRLFYPNDCLCEKSLFLDQVKVTIKTDDGKIRENITSIGYICDDTPFVLQTCAQQIRKGALYVGLIDEKSQIVYDVFFNETQTNVRAWGELSAIITNVTGLFKPTIIDYEEYDCEIIGDGTVQHYGLETAKILIDCKRV